MNPANTIKLVDTHTHLNDEKFACDLDAVIKRAAEAGVERIIVCGCDMQSSLDAVQLAEKYDPIYATVGVHPHDAKNYNTDAGNTLRNLSSNPKVLAIGEIGLDFHYNFSPPQMQFAAFEAQMDLAGQLGLPVVVHSRESNPEALQALRNHASKIVGCVFHCFSGDAEFAKDVLDMGFYIGIDGPITYKASQKLREVVRMCPMDRLLIETDCPYLTPVPFRGKRNEPAYVRYVADEIAQVKGISIESVALATTQNADRLFWRRAAEEHR